MSEFYWDMEKHGHGIGLQILLKASDNPAFADQPYGRVYKVHAKDLWKAEEYCKVPAGDLRETIHSTQEEAKAYLLAVTRMR